MSLKKRKQKAWQVWAQWGTKFDSLYILIYSENHFTYSQKNQYICFSTSILASAVSTCLILSAWQLFLPRSLLISLPTSFGGNQPGNFRTLKRTPMSGMISITVRMEMSLKASIQRSPRINSVKNFLKSGAMLSQGD